MASPDDDFYYLAPSFDPTFLTIPRLRNILMSHDIEYPASAKKPQLVDIFTEELKPKARKLLSARDKVRRTSRGITDMPSSQEGTINGDHTDDDDDDDGQDASSMPPPPTPRQRQPRKSARASAEPVKRNIPSTVETSGNRRGSSKHARQSDTETDRDLEPKRPTVRKSRKSESTPKIKVEPSEERPRRPPMRGDVFSDDNPFQSGSSPLIPEEGRRRTAGSSSDRRKSSSGRRKTEGTSSTSKQQQDGISPPTSKTFEVPISRLKRPTEETEPEDSLAAGEEFTPEAQLELVRANAASGKRDILPPRQRKRQQKSGMLPRSAPWVIFMSLLGGYATWWRQEKQNIGYCGISRPSNALLNNPLPAWASALQPICEPCPQHAICYEGMETKCEEDFVLQPHPMSLGGLVPLPPTCEPDGEKVRRIKVVADRAVEELRERKAQAECGTLKNERRSVGPEAIDEEDLRDAVSKKRRRGMTNSEFDDLWKGALGDIKEREDIQISDSGPHTYISSTSLARISLTCAIKRQARLALARYRVSIILLSLLSSGILYVRSSIRKSRNDSARVPHLVATTLDRLATQATLQTRGDTTESWISVGQLRDDVLRDEFSDKRRESLWKRVGAIVERNANVRASVREGRGGDISRVWEWIGSVGLLDEPWSGVRDSGGGKRVSFGRIDEDKVEGEKIPHGRDLVEQRKWDEGRPIY